jgi:hypothetical protein
MADGGKERDATRCDAISRAHPAMTLKIGIVTPPCQKSFRVHDDPRLAITVYPDVKEQH